MADQRNRPLHGPAPADHTVRLRPIAGVAPGTWLTLLYGAALLALLFLVAVYPGLRFNGSLITFSSSPSGAAVYLDGRFAGTTPVTTRAAAGRRTVLLSKEHFQPREEQLEVGGRLLLSWPFPRRASHHLALRIEDPPALARSALLDLAQSPAIARIITDAAADLAAPGAASGTGTQLPAQRHVADRRPGGAGGAPRRPRPAQLRRRHTFSARGSAAVAARPGTARQRVSRTAPVVRRAASCPRLWTNWSPPPGTRPRSAITAWRAKPPQRPPRRPRPPLR